MLQKQIILLLLLLLSSCGYEAIYSKKNFVDYDFTVSDLSFVGDRTVNLKIKEKLKNYTQDKKEKDFILKISSISEKVIISKNTAGDATSFKNSVSINVEVLKDVASPAVFFAKVIFSEVLEILSIKSLSFFSLA